MLVYWCQETGVNRVVCGCVLCDPFRAQISLILLISVGRCWCLFILVVALVVALDSYSATFVVLIREDLSPNSSHMSRWSSLPPGWGRVEFLEAAFLRCLIPGMRGLLRLRSGYFV